MTIPKLKGQNCQSQCRLCGKKSRKGILIFKEKVAVPKESQPTTTTTNLGVNSGERQLQLAELIFECLHLKVTEDDLLPKHVCTECEKKLTSWLSFFTKCKETQENFQKTLPATVTVAVEPSKSSLSQNLCKSEPESTSTASVEWATTEEKKTLVESVSKNEKSSKDKETDTEPFLYSCPVCKKSFSKRPKFAQHLASHVKPEADLWPCPVCPKKLRSCDGLARHQETHLESRNYCCHVCGRLFQTLTCLLNHLRMQHSPETGPDARPRHACPICGRIFRQSTHMVQHLRTHTGERPYWCHECNSRFTTSGQLQRHIQAVHQGLKRFKCDLCGKEFLYSHNYKAHMQRHEGNKDLRCDMCEKSFFTKNALFRHRRFHTGEKPFQCDICGKKFADCSNRKRHRQQHHKLALPEVPGSETVLATTAEGGSVQVVLMETPEEMASAAEEEEGKTFTSLQTFLMEDFLRVELVTFDEDAAGDRITLVRSASELVGQDEECLSVGLQPVEVTLHPEDLASSLPHIDPCPEDAPFNLDTIPSDPVDISTTLDTPVDLSPSLHSMAGSPLHITPPSLRNSPSNLSPTLETNPLDLSPSLQPMGGSPLHMPSSDFLLTLHGY